MANPYINILLSHIGGSFLLSADASHHASVSSKSFAFPFELTALPSHEEIADWVDSAHRLILRDRTHHMKARELGAALFNSVFRGDLLETYRYLHHSLNASEYLRLRLRQDDSLPSIPWELMFDPQTDLFLVCDPKISLVRFPQSSEPVLPLRVDGPLEMVVVFAPPSGQVPIRAQEHRERIENALRKPQATGRVRLSFIEGRGTTKQLQERLDRPFHILHIVCHGTIAADGEGVLIFEDDSGDSVDVSADSLRPLLRKQHGHIRLVVLNSCLGAARHTTDPYSSVGQSLSLSGIPAVVAMQFVIDIPTAANLSGTLYSALARNKGIEQSLSEARMILHVNSRYTLDWAIPVLYYSIPN